MANFQPSRKQRHVDALLHQVEHSERRSSMSSICAGIQHSGGARMVTPKLLIRARKSREVTMSTSATKRSMSQAAAVAAVLFGLLSPTRAEVPQHNDLTSHSPWLAPVGHRQPTKSDVPGAQLLSSWERQQIALDAELDRKLIICRGC